LLGLVATAQAVLVVCLLVVSADGTCTLRKKFFKVASFWTISARLCWLKVMGCDHEDRQNSSRSCLAENSRNASRIVMKFFNDLDIFRPSIARCPLCSQ
jgi:hypothetical protein